MNPTLDIECFHMHPSLLKTLGDLCIIMILQFFFCIYFSAMCFLCSASFLKLVEIHQTVHFKCVHFIICKLYLNKVDLKN